jgi:hypothetical protein
VKRPGPGFSAKASASRLQRYRENADKAQRSGSKKPLSISGEYTLGMDGF